MSEDLPQPTDAEPAADQAVDRAPEGTADPAEENRRRMREALEHKRGAQHPDDRARGAGGVRGGSTGPSRRDFTRRKSG